MIESPEFAECAACAAKPGFPSLCRACLHNRATINQLHTKCEVLTKVYVAAARLRTFPVPFDDHFALIGAADECRSVLEPPIDTDDTDERSPEDPDVSDTEIKRLTGEIRALARRITTRTKNVIKLFHAYREKWRSRD